MSDIKTITIRARHPVAPTKPVFMGVGKIGPRYITYLEKVFDKETSPMDPFGLTVAQHAVFANDNDWNVRVLFESYAITNAALPAQLSDAYISFLKTKVEWAKEVVKTYNDIVAARKRQADAERERRHAEQIRMSNSLRPAIPIEQAHLITSEKMPNHGISGAFDGRCEEMPSGGLISHLENGTGRVIVGIDPAADGCDKTTVMVREDGEPLSNLTVLCPNSTKHDVVDYGSTNVDYSGGDTSSTSSVSLD